MKYNPTLLELAWKQFDDLTEYETKLFEAVETGKSAKLHPDWKSINPSKADLPVLRAECVEWLLTDKHAVERITNDGVTIIGARFKGGINASFVRLQWELSLLGCHVQKTLSLHGAELGSLDLAGCHIAEFYANNMLVNGDVHLDAGFTATDEVSLYGTSIGGTLVCSGGTFRNPDGYTFNAAGMKVKGSVFLDDEFTSEGEVNLIGASIDGDLSCTKGTFRNPGGDALRIDGMQLNLSLFLNEGFTSEGEVGLMGASIGGSLDCSKSSFRNPDGIAINADGMLVTGHTFLNKGFSAEGVVNLFGASIGGNLECSEGSFRNPTERVLYASHIQVKGSVHLDEGFIAEGGVFLAGASVGSNLECSNGTFQNPQKLVLDAGGAKIAGDIILSDRFASDGEIHLVGAIIGGSLECDNGTYINVDNEALNAEGVVVNGSVFCRAMTIQGQISFEDSSIKGVLQIKSNKWGKGSTLTLSGASAKTLMDQSNGWPSKGNLTLNGFTYDDIDDWATTGVKKRLEWLELQPNDFYRPQPYEQLASVLGQAGHENRAREVRIARNRKLQSFFGCPTSSQLGHKYWKQFEDASGDERFKLAAQMLPESLDKETENCLNYSLIRRFWHRTMGILTGYGYQAWRVPLFMLLAIVIGMVVFGLGYPENMTETHKSLYSNVMEGGLPGTYNWEFEHRDDPTLGQLLPDDYPHFNAFLYSVDSFLPLVDLDQEDFWMPNSNAPWGESLRFYHMIHLMIGWFFTYLLLAAVTGLMKK